MKKTLLTITLLLATLASQAQEQKRYTREGDTFIEVKATPTSTDQKTAYTWKDAKGKEYPIYLHDYKQGEKKGRTTAYVIRTSSKTGKEYKYYLPDGERIAEEIIKENQ
jgi:hypothetical protein